MNPSNIKGERFARARYIAAVCPAGPDPMITYDNHKRFVSSKENTRHTTFECNFLLRSFFLGGITTGIPRAFVVGEADSAVVENPDEYLLLIFWVSAVALTDESLRKTRKVEGREKNEGDSVAEED